MRDRPTCDDVLELLPELALGVADAEERARALSHVDDCPRCRRRLAELSDVGDELLLMAPPQDPPPGFEDRVLERISASRPAAPGGEGFLRRWRAVLAVAPAAAAVAAVIAGVGVYERTETDRELGALYRQTLQVANGQAFGALPLHERRGRRAGHVFGYEGEPSWLFVVVARADAGRYRVELVTRRGVTHRLGALRVNEGRASFGAILPVRLFDIARVRLVGRGANVLTAEAPPLPGG